MTIKDLHDNLRLMIPEGDGRYFAPANLDNFIHLAVMDLFNQDYKIFEESQRITETLAFFRASSAIPIAASVGSLPSNLMFISKLLCTKIGSVVVERGATLITNQFANDLFISEAFGPTENDIYIERIAGAIQVRPATVTEITVTYLRKPTKAVFGYTTSIDGFSKVYNVGSSTQIDFPEQAHPEIMNKALRYIGVGMKQPALVQAEGVAKAGNQPEAR